jgi:hypothetical protein
MVTVEHVKAGLQQGWQLGLSGFMGGVAVGWINLIGGTGPVDMAATSAQLFPLQGVLLALIMLAQLRAKTRGPGRERFSQLDGALAEQLLAAVVGGVLGIAAFIGGAAQIPAIFGGQSAATIVEAMIPALGWVRIAFVLGVICAAALLGALWANRQARPRVRAR